ncbi:DegT/DnrJ/EryC1/StrS aminotransferase family protein [Pelagibacteraceae bacterium]|nr:DegT/DnrJ/EryC1/StrS aminotransferase family protein [Pelagibacteraceae bacterium]
MKKLTWPKYSLKEIKLVNKIIKSGKVNQWTGVYVKKFEKKFSNFFNLNYSLAVANGTVGLEAAIHSLNLDKDSEIIVTPRSFIASASSVLKMNFKPVFSDIDIHSQNIELENIKKVISNKTKAIICVHLAGYPTRMKEIIAFARKKNIYIIEDCSQAHGAKINDKFTGTFGDVSVWSFCQDKIISTLGEGGMISTNNIKIYNRLLSYRDHGKNYKNLSNIKNLDKFNYINDFIGTNIRMTEIQAAVGYLQLDNLNSWIKARNLKIRNLEKKLSKIKKGIVLIKIPKNIRHSYYRYYFFIKTKKFKKGWNYLKLINTLRQKDKSFFIGGCPEIYNEKIFQRYKPKNKLNNVVSLSKSSVCIRIDQNLTNKKIEYLSKSVENVFLNAFL